MTSILKDSVLDDTLRSEGFVVIPLLDAATKAELKNLFYQKHPEPVMAMYASAHDPNIQLRKFISDTIKEKALPFIEDVIPGVEVLGGSFIAKGNHAQATLPPHQDWNIVDEQQFRSFNLWIPLVDTGIENGGIMVLPRSHLFGFNYRGPNISSAYEQVADLLLQHMEVLNIPAGHALLYDHRLLHASGVNEIQELRLVAVMGVIEKGASMRIYYKEGDRIQEYACTPEFFNTHNPQQGPLNLVLLKSLEWTFRLSSTSQVRTFFKKHGLASRGGSHLKTILTYLKKMFS